MQEVTENVRKDFRAKAQRRKGKTCRAAGGLLCVFAPLREKLSMVIEQDSDVTPHVRLVQRRVFK